MDQTSTFEVPAYENVSPESQGIFDQLKKTAGMVPNLYAFIGYSGNALGSYLTYVQAQAKGSFHNKEREAIFLIVSELNGCEYCLSSHTLGAIKNHWTEVETLQLRAGTISDPKWQAIYQVIQAVIANKGEVAMETLLRFFEAGYDRAALIDLMVLINVMSLTNYVYRLSQVHIDYPLAKSLNP